MIENGSGLSLDRWCNPTLIIVRDDLKHVLALSYFVIVRRNNFSDILERKIVARIDYIDTELYSLYYCYIKVIIGIRLYSCSFLGGFGCVMPTGARSS